MGKKQTVFAFMHQSKQQAEAPQALFGCHITWMVWVLYRHEQQTPCPIRVMSNNFGNQTNGNSTETLMGLAVDEE